MEGGIGGRVDDELWMDGRISKTRRLKGVEGMDR